MEPVGTVSASIIRLITYRDLKIAMLLSTHAASIGYPGLASVLNDIQLGRTNISLPLPFPFQDNIRFCSQTSRVEQEPFLASYNEDVGTAISCVDSSDTSNTILQEFTSYLRLLESQSRIAPFQAEYKLRCLHWPASVRAKYRCEGPFGSDKLEAGMLFVNNALDPVTPVRNALEWRNCLR